MIRKLAGVAARLRRPRVVALAAAVGLGVVFVPVVASAPPALALNCSYDAFYLFQSRLTNGYAAVGVPPNAATTVSDSPTSATSFCQVHGSHGGIWYEWVQKGTSNCLTLNATEAWEDMITCNQLASQQWELGDQIGTGEKWGWVESYYVFDGQHYWMDDMGSNAPIGWSIQWPAENGGSGFNLIYNGT
jgi:hypothetical protein